MPKYLELIDHDFRNTLIVRYRDARLFCPNFIFDLFGIELGTLPSQKVSKLRVQYTDAPSRHLTPECLLDVLLVDYYFPVDDFVRWDFAQQKEFFLDSILCCLTAYAGTYGWDVQHCRQTYDTVRELGVSCDRYWATPVLNVSNGLSGQVHVTYFESIELSIVVRNGDGSVLNRRTFAALPGTLAALEDAHGKLVWQSDAMLRLYRKNGKDFWEYNIDTDMFEFYFERAQRGDAHGQYDLGRMYLDGWLVFHDKELAVYWLRRSAEQGFKRAQRMLERLEHQET